MGVNLEEMYKNLSLTEAESEEIIVDVGKLQDAVLSRGKCLVVKLLTHRHYNREAFKHTMRRAWRPVRGIKFRDLNSSIMLIEFDDECDKDRVIRDGPWSFDKHLVLVKEVEGHQQVHQIQFTEASFLVRLHDLPFIARNEYMGSLLGSKIGKVIEVDIVKGEVAWGEFLRVRVAMDISKPLLRGKLVNIGLEKPVWIRFSYERLPNFCYCCGLLNHSHSECVKWKDQQHSVGEEGFPYGNWLRAGIQFTRRGHRREVAQESDKNKADASVPLDSQNRKDGSSGLDPGENLGTVCVASVTVTEVHDSVIPTMVADSEKAVTKVVIKETEADDMHVLISVDKELQREDSVIQKVSLESSLDSGNAVEMGLNNPGTKVDFIKPKAQEVPAGSRRSKPNVLEGRKWKCLSILDKPKSPISVSPKHLPSGRKRKVTVKDGETEVRDAKRTMVSPLPIIESEVFHDFPTAVVGSQHRREP
ncbi:uncharacterized protein LOC122298810 [Carya illinoinensis]|uniref:uncharacterized protein LOC122298810 n=1 Tax=Carya illinoinensis TaxID=32201 RepID=UPI001C720C39|nr:uncharacterized protein LOC122298810 [Carya illinoinensis]